MHHHGDLVAARSHGLERLEHLVPHADRSKTPSEAHVAASCRAAGQRDEVECLVDMRDRNAKRRSIELHLERNGSHGRSTRAIDPECS